MASAAPPRPQPRPNMKSGVQPIWRTSEAVDQMAGTRTLPSPRSTLSNMPLRKVMAAPPKRRRRHHLPERHVRQRDRKSTRLNSSHGYISYAVFCLKKKKYIKRVLVYKM